MYWGYHLMIDSSRCLPKSIRCKQNIETFAKHLVKKIDMVPFGQPQVQHFGSGNKAGYTLVQLIETSNIVAHFVEETDDMYLDVFSCKPFKQCDVEMMVQKYFNPIYLTRHYIVRQARQNGNTTVIPELR
jgi:S-adenosylmethionine/arginine decarboxylase-like enzyme